jgi:hypothetical protein
MPNLHLQIHPDFIPMTSRVIIWDFRLRISDLWNRYALSIICGQDSLNLKSKFKNLKLHPTYLFKKPSALSHRGVGHRPYGPAAASSAVT